MSAGTSLYFSGFAPLSSYTLTPVDPARHPAVHRYVEALPSRPTIRPGDSWNAGYARFGDRFEEALAYTPPNTHPNSIFKLLVRKLDDSWNAVGLSADELPHINWLWKGTANHHRARLVGKVLHFGAPDQRYDEVVAWCGHIKPYLSRPQWFHAGMQGWVGPILGGVVGHWTIDELLSFVDAGFTFAEVAAVTSAGVHDFAQVRAVLVDKVPIEYAMLS